jgi:predicted RNA-binding protein with PIN domain
MHIIVDGYNLIRQSDLFRHSERRSLEQGRNALIRSLSAYRKLRGHRLTVVFDGWEGGSPAEERDLAGGVEIIYSRLGEKADEVIKRLIEECGQECLVVTSDREVALFATRRGRAAIAARDFDALLEKSAAGSAAAGIAVAGCEEEEAGKPGGKKKGPSRRISKRQRTALASFRKL